MSCLAPIVRASFRSLFALASLAGVAGCAAIIPGTTMFNHDKGSMEGPGEAPSDGEYVLHQKYGDVTPLKTVQLKKGDRLGFRTSETGRIIAVAGETEWTFEDSPLVWKRKD